ncbi:T9SS type A sorting domain-containing protein [Taibaiella koreensis]|uniref:T9SS type A sorting domain-containing protein n=1 Tax=Taibaiella koreensis TaxID=1268548 RepID=UPI000E59E942|nr:T9SS type A sorting domain-containing protein [Taibaiella koreensis]
MLNQYQNFFRKLLLCSATILALTPRLLQAQTTIVTPSNPDQFLSATANINLPSVNCDMLFIDKFPAPSGNIKAFAWNSPTGARISAIDFAGNAINIPAITNASFADIVIADDITLTHDCIIAVVFLRNTSVYLNTYYVDGVGSAMTYTPAASVQLSTTPTLDQSPHIDMFADIAQGIPIMHRCVVSWSQAGGLGSVVYAAYGEIANPAGLSGPYLISSGTNNTLSDVAASYSIAAGVDMAYLVIGNLGNNTLDFASLNCASGTVSGFSLATGTFHFPRIEAMAVDYSPFNPNIPWTVVAAKINGTVKQTWMFNNSGSYNCSAPFSSSENFLTAIAAGVGNIGTGFNNKNYSIGWNLVNNNIFVTQPVDFATGAITVPSTFYQVNSNPITPFLPGKVPFAMSSSSNRGNALLTAWFDNVGNLWYKETPDITGYKPTEIEGARRLTGCTLYPNPAHDVLHVTGIGDGGYTITNIAGQILSSGPVSRSSSQLNIAFLPDGIYNLTLKEGQKMQCLKFVKK